MQDPTLPSIFFNNGTAAFEFQALSPSLYFPDSKEAVDHFLIELNKLPPPHKNSHLLAILLLTLLTVVSYFLLTGDGLVQYAVLCVEIVVLTFLVYNPGVVHFAFKRSLKEFVENRKKRLARYYAIKVCKLELRGNRLEFLLQLLPKRPKVIELVE